MNERIVKGIEEMRRRRRMRRRGDGNEGRRYIRRGERRTGGKGRLGGEGEEYWEGRKMREEPKKRGV